MPKIVENSQETLIKPNQPVKIHIDSCYGKCGPITLELPFKL